LAFSDILSDLGIKNLALKVKVEELADLPTPFILHYPENDGSCLVVTQANSEQIICIDNRNKPHSIILKEFPDLWHGNVLCVETNHNSIELNYVNNKRKEILRGFKWILSGGIFLLILGLNHNSLLKFVESNFTFIFPVIRLIHKWDVGQHIINTANINKGIHL